MRHTATEMRAVIVRDTTKGKVRIFLTKKELHEIWKSRKSPHIRTNTADFMERYTQHKMKKWERKHPRPWKWQGTEEDLFEEEYAKPWERLRELELIRIRGVVISMYDKVSLTGRYRISEGKYEQRPVSKIKDKSSDIMRYDGINNIPKHSKLICTAQKIVNEERIRNPEFITGLLKDHKKTHGRLVLPECAKIHKYIKVA